MHYFIFRPFDCIIIYYYIINQVTFLGQQTYNKMHYFIFRPFDCIIIYYYIINQTHCNFENP